MSKNTNLSFLTDYITADITNGRIGINNASPTVAFDVVGATKITGALTLTSTISNGTYTYTLPSATGTLALTSALSGYLPLTGGTLTGALGGTSATFSATVRLTSFLRLTKGSSSIVYDSSSNVPRFETSIINTESGSNTGSDFVIYSYSDAGSYLATPLTITRSTGAATFSSSVTATTAGLFSDFNGGAFTARGSGSTLKYTGIGYDSTGNYGWIQSQEQGTAYRNLVLNAAGGNVGIGTSSPSNKLDINQTGSAINSVSGVGLKIYADAGNDVSLALSQTARGTFFLENLSAGAVPSDIRFRADVASNFIFMSNSTERMRITSGGLLAIGTTVALINESSLAATSNGNTVTFKTTLNGGNPLLLWNTASGSQAQVTFFTGTSYTAAGSITANGTTTSYNTTSDYRLKEDLKEIKGIEKLLAIKVYDFKWKREELRMDGVIAHELQEVLPYAVIGEKDGEKMQQVDYSKIVPVLVKAIQELSAEITILKNK
jgi:hypothetical protein